MVPKTRSSLTSKAHVEYRTARRSTSTLDPPRRAVSATRRLPRASGLVQHTRPTRPQTPRCANPSCRPSIITSPAPAARPTTLTHFSIMHTVCLVQCAALPERQSTPVCRLTLCRDPFDRDPRPAPRILRDSQGDIVTSS
eukprot:6542262-Prymnesium_polylepis.1